MIGDLKRKNAKVKGSELDSCTRWSVVPDFDAPGSKKVIRGECGVPHKMQRDARAAAAKDPIGLSRWTRGNEARAN